MHQNVCTKQEQSKVQTRQSTTEIIKVWRKTRELRSESFAISSEGFSYKNHNPSIYIVE